MDRFVSTTCLMIYITYVVKTSQKQQPIVLPDIIAEKRDQVSVSQTNTWSTCYASRLVDGLNGQNVSSGDDRALCLQCSVAQVTATENAWMILDLTHAYVVFYIIIYGRTRDVTDQSKQIELFTSNSPQLSTTPWIKLNNYMTKYTDTLGTIARIDINPPVTFRYVEIQKTTAGVLTLCEVEIHGKELRNVIADNGNNITVTQSNRYSSSCYANRSIDGLDGQNLRFSPNSDSALCAQCSVAGTVDGTAWWQLDLTQEHRVYYIMIYGRTDSKMHTILVVC